MERLEDGHFMTEKYQVARYGNPCRAGTDNSNFFTGWLCPGGYINLPLLCFPVGKKSLQPANCYLSLFVRQYTLGFTL